MEIQNQYYLVTNWHVLSMRDFFTGRGYNVIGSCATTLGVLATAFPDFAAVSTGCTRAVAMQLMFGLFAVLGLVTFPSAPALPGLAVSVTTTAAILFLERHLLGGLLSPLRAYALDRAH